MLFRSLARALAIAIWNTSLRSFAPYDGRREERHADRYDERYGQRDDGQWATTLTRPDRGYRDSYRDEDPPRQPTRGRTLALAGLALAALLVVAATIAVEARLGTPRITSPGSGTGLATATTTAVVTQTPSAPADPTPVNFAALGWTKRGPSLVDQIRMAPSAPGTVYTCGPFGGGPGLGFGVSQDGGQTWQTWATSINAAVCGDLKVSPTAAQAISIDSWTCRADCGAGDEYLHYSLDGGKHWTQVIQTAENGNGGGAGTWVGTTFFTSTPPDNTPAAATQYLAVSKNGGPFSWTSLPYPGTLFSNATTIYATPLIGGANIGIYASTDQGATWTHGTSIYNSRQVNAIFMAPGGPMLGYDAAAFSGPNTYPLLRSRDGGATWQALPMLPSGLQASTQAFGTPDGTAYMGGFGSSFGLGGLYKLRPGASQWTLVSPVVPAYLHLNDVTWDANGHPTTLWGLQETQNNTSIPWVHSA